jgi:hypothetical protein
LVLSFLLWRILRSVIPANAPYRHSGEGRNPFSLFVIPAKAGTQRFRFATLRTDAAFVPVGLRPPSLAGESLSLLAQRK